MQFLEGFPQLKWLTTCLCPQLWVYFSVKAYEVFLCFIYIIMTLLVLSIVLTFLFSLFYVTCECNRFLHWGCHNYFQKFWISHMIPKSPRATTDSFWNRRYITLSRDTTGILPSSMSISSFVYSRNSSARAVSSAFFLISASMKMKEGNALLNL